MTYSKETRRLPHCSSRADDSRNCDNYGKWRWEGLACRAGAWSFHPLRRTWLWSTELRFALSIHVCPFCRRSERGSQRELNMGLKGIDPDSRRIRGAQKKYSAIQSLKVWQAESHHLTAKIPLGKPLNADMKNVITVRAAWHVRSMFHIYIFAKLFGMTFLSPGIIGHR